MKFSDFLKEGVDGKASYSYILPPLNEERTNSAERSIRSNFPQVTVKVSDSGTSGGRPWTILECRCDTINPLLRIADGLKDVGFRQVKFGLARLSYDSSDLGLGELTSVPKTLDCGLDVSDNELTSLKDISKHFTHINGTVYAEGNNITSHVLGLLKIPGILSTVLAHHNNYDLAKVQKIINKYLPNIYGNEGVLDCQNELIDAGLDEYAQL